MQILQYISRSQLHVSLSTYSQGRQKWGLPSLSSWKQQQQINRWMDSVIWAASCAFCLIPQHLFRQLSPCLSCLDVYRSFWLSDTLFQYSHHCSRLKIANLFGIGRNFQWYHSALWAVFFFISQHFKSRVVAVTLILLTHKTANNKRAQF